MAENRGNGSTNGRRARRAIPLELRRRVLLEEPFCPGYPQGVHGDPCACGQGKAHGRAHVRTTVVDHLKGLELGGGDARANLGGKCAACNSRKSIEREGARGGPEGWRNR